MERRLWGFSADGRFAYVANPIDDALAVFERDPASGRLVLVELHIEEDGQRPTQSSSNRGMTTVTASPDGRHVYTGSSYSGTISAFGHSQSDCRQDSRILCPEREPLRSSARLA